MTVGLPDNPQMNYTVLAGAESVTLRCPYEPASLINCYYGEWRKGSVVIASVPQPQTRDCAPGDILIANPLKHELEKNTFSLVINSPQASDDDGDYTCALVVLDPAVNTGSGELKTFTYPTDITLTLTVDGMSLYYNYRLWQWHVCSCSDYMCIAN